ncbi:HI_0552 family protein [Rossellomorea aquimaris]|uniref:HI_0552 family protein n=1 Tax=Rossellomorea aquimaris TaxID=189382 RepID=UPI0007D09AFF|nr:HI_0552 family protein [Rossellomorea aquimaris]
MKLHEKHFELFDREFFLFAKLKEEMSPEEVERVKETYKESWGSWKALMQNVYNSISSEFSEPITESWTNGWSVRTRFWTRLKYKDREQSSSCIAAMINEYTLRVYLEWHKHSSESSSTSVQEHNLWLDHMEEWIESENINTSEYSVWTTAEGDDEKYITLDTFLRDKELQKQYKELLSTSEGRWIRVGKVFSKKEVLSWDEADQEIAKIIEELQGIYDKTQDGSDVKRNYWLFNVYHSQNPMVWEKSREYGVAAMQYEEGKQKLAAVTRNLNIIKEIAIGDYVIAYTGNKGFLAIGQVTKPFFNEEDESKFIDVNGEGWRQRIGVEWFKTLDEPVRSSESGFKSRMGLDSATVMGSASIFKIPEEGYRFVQQLMDDESTALTNTFSGIFNSMEEAEWTFNLTNQSLNQLGILEPGDQRVSMTLSSKKLRVNFCKWLILGFYKDEERLFLELALPESEINDAYHKNMFANEESEEPIAIAHVPAEDFKNDSHLQKVYFDTLKMVKDRFKNYSKSPYRKAHIPQLEQAVFNPEKRPEVLTKEFYSTIPPTEDKKTRYFWLTASPSIWSVEEIKDGGAVNYTAYNEKGNKRRVYSAFENARPEDKIIFYESTPRKEIVAQGEVVKGLHEVEEEGFDEPILGVSFRYIEDITPISWETISQVEELQSCSPIKNGAQGSLFEITKEEFETILSLEPTNEVIKEVKIPTVSFKRKLNLYNLYFEDKDLLLKQVETALRNGKHIILTGPPGTGKSKLAKQICRSFEADYKMATATSDWSTYETIGGYRPKSDGTLSFNPGLFLQCFKDGNNNKPINKWLIIDEMNRADIDKAFGSLFSALTGDTITLNFLAESGHPLLLRPQGEEETMEPNNHEYLIPNDWRLIGTMNTMDKASLYEMSYAFMRRFAFIPVGVPKRIDEDLVQHFLNAWDISDYKYTEVLAVTWQKINDYRQIGPAIVEDLAKYTALDSNFTSAIILYVLPQFEGLMDKEILEFIEGISHLKEVDGELLKQFAEDFFHVKG